MKLIDCDEERTEDSEPCQNLMGWLASQQKEFILSRKNRKGPFKT